MILRRQTNKKKILFVGAEMWPYAAAGGLGRVMFNLPAALNKLGVDARVFFPKYGKIDQKIYHLEYVQKGLKVPTGGNEKDIICNVLQHKLPNGPIAYFLENREYYELRANEYGYIDDPTRWGILQRGMWEFIRKNEDWTPDVIQCNDWQTALIANMQKQYYADDPRLSKIKVVLTMHSLRFQAPYDHSFVSQVEYDSGQSLIPSILSPDFNKLNSMRRGVVFSDYITTVSPTYAKEILTKEYGEGLDKLLSELKSKYTGILNGISNKEFDPVTDQNIVKNFKNKEWSKRQENKAFLQRTFNLKQSLDKPLFLISYRLAEQKGIDLIKDIMETVINEFDAQLIVKGDGDSGYKNYFTYLSTKYPQNVALQFDFDFKILTQLFAGADFLLHPSRFEPCGIVHLEAMRYGCIPIVRKVGGLADTVFEDDNGFVFSRYDSRSLLMAISRAYELFKHSNLINNYRESAMSKDYSWGESAEKYLELYNSIIN